MAAAPAAERTTLDRFLAAIPFAVAALVIGSILIWEAGAVRVPTIFTDELEWAQLSRAIAATGHAARRGQAIGFKSLYAYLIAPGWWIHSTANAYRAIRYLDTAVMALTALPVYALARQLVSRRAAAVVALGSLCTSALFFAPLLLPEVLAYPTFALYAYLVVRALATKSPRWIAATVVCSPLAVEVRNQLICAVGAAVGAAIWLWLVGPQGRRLRGGWSVRDHLGAVVLLAGIFVLVNRTVLQHSAQWQIASQYYSGRIWHYGLVSGSALAIGLGVLPAIGGLASLWIPERRDDPRWRAFAAFLGASIATFGVYTGVKATTLSLGPFARVEERNLIYLGPLLLVGTAAVLASRRLPLASLLVSTAFVAWLVLHYGYQLDFPYFESPGYGIAAMANRAFHWTQPDIRRALAVVTALSLVLLTAPRWLARRPAAARALLAATAVAVATWMLAGEVTSARGTQAAAQRYASGLAQPLDWVDRATGGRPTTYLGQAIPSGGDVGLWETEFWNRYSVRHVDSLDATAPGPGPVETPSLSAPDGTLTGDLGTPFVLADNGVDLVGTVVARRGTLALTRILRHPWRLRQAVYNYDTAGGWIANNPDGSFAYFGSTHRPGTLVVSVGRQGFNATSAPNTDATVTVGPVALDQQGNPIVAHPTATRHVHVVNGAAPHVFRFTVRPPFVVHIHVSSLVQASLYGLSDGRMLGVQASYGFTPTR